MTSTTLFYLLLRKKLSLRDRLIIKEELNYNKLSGLVRLIRNIIILTISTEFVGATLLYLYFNNIFPEKKALFFSIFHSVSAFNNAGFDLFGNSLEDYFNSLYINFILSFLFIFGGLGFIVILELFSRNISKLSLHSKFVLTITVVLIIVGTISLFILESDNPLTLGKLSLKNKLLAAFFQAVTPRTAGFNTIKISYFKDVSLFILIILMFIGASPASTGGGIKTTTIGTLLMLVYNVSLGKEDIELYNRRLSQKIIYKALTVVVISIFVISMVTIVLTITENFSFIQILFEVFSAFATVGLSTGITPKLSSLGKIFIIITMFIGRVGPFTIAIAVANRRHENIRFPEEDILIG